MSYEQILYDVADSVATITLNRPDRLNAVTARSIDELIAAFDAADADDGVRAVIVTGAGRAFCAGADLGAGGRTFDRADRSTADEHRVLRRGSPGRAPGESRRRAGRVARDRARAGGRDRRQHVGRLRRADPPDAVEAARRRPSSRGPPDRLAGDVLDGTLTRCPR